MNEWDDSIVDFAAPIDGFLTRSFGGRSGPLALENGAAITFPWQTQQEIPGTVPSTVVSYDDTGLGFTALSLEGPTMVAAADRAYVDLRGFNDGTPQLVLGSGVASEYISISGGQALISTPGSFLTLNAGVTLTSPLGGVDISAETAIQITNDTTNGTTITIDSNGALNLVGVPVNINGVDVSTGLTWTTFTSGLIQSGAPTFTATYCKYTKVGRTVTVSMSLAITATGSAMAGNAVQITLPFTAVQGGNLTVGSGHVFENSPTGSFPARVVLNSTTTARLQPTNVTTGGYLGVVQFVNALAASDAIDMTFTYEATT